MAGLARCLWGFATVRALTDIAVMVAVLLLFDWLFGTRTNMFGAVAVLAMIRIYDLAIKLERGQ